MGLRCLLGHDFDEPELRREREEDGNEVVTTVTEVKTCARCGETQIVSENTEVTTMEQLADEAASTETASTRETTGRHDGRDGGAVTSGADGAKSFGGAADGVDATAEADASEGDGSGDGDDAVIIDDGPGESADPAEQTVEATGTPEDEGAELLDEGAPEASTDIAPGGDYEEYPDVEPEATQTNGERGAQTDDELNAGASDEQNAETDDGVILDETSEPDDDRERGAWPEVEGDESPGAEPTPWPEQEGDDEGYSAEVGDSSGSGDVEFGGGLTPEAAEEVEGDDGEYVEAPERGSATGAGAVEAEAVGAENGDVDVGITRGESPDIGPSTADVTMEYYCPECEMTRDADGNSMRAGDICPECKRGYVTERPVGN